MKGQINISDEDFDLIAEGLESLRKRCKANAEKCKNGYGSAKSADKSFEYLRKSEDISELLSRLSTEMI